MLRKPPVIISDVQPSKDGVSNKSLAPPKDKARRKQSFTLNMVAYTHHTEEGTVPEGQSVPEFLSKPYSLTLMEGKSATFRARVSGTPTPTVTWQRINGEPVVSGSDYKVHYDQRKDEHIMEVPKVLSKFADTYRCTASNVHAEASIAVALIAISLRKSAPLQMKEEVSDAADFRAKLKKRVEEEKVPEKTFDEKEVWDILMSADRKDYEAICFKYGIKDFRGMLRRLQAMKEAKEEEEENELQLRKALKHVKVNAEGTAVFEIYMGRLDPSKNLRFFKNGRLLTIDETEGKHMLKKIDDKYCLVINNVNANDDGDYAVEVDGQMIKAGHLHYTDEQVFIRQLQSMRCYERESVTFECKLTMPTPTATWNFKSLELIESNKYEMKVLDGGKTHQLTINNTRMVDKGVYSIVVFGCSSVAWLEVAKSAIKFKSGFRSVRARAGDTASFSSELNIEGTNATWLKDKLPITASDIDSGRIKVFSDGGKHGISFHPAAEKDTGEYTVVVKQDDDDKEYTANTFLRVEAADDDANKKERQERRTQKAMVAPPKSTGDGGKRGDDKSTSGKGGKGDGSKSGLDKSADAGKGLKGNAGLDDGSRKKIPPPPVIMIEPVDGNNVGNGFGNGGSGDGSDLLDKSGSGDGGDGSGLGDGADLGHIQGTGDKDSGRNRQNADPNAALPRKGQPTKQPVDLSHQRGTGDEDTGRDGRDSDSNAAPPRKGKPAKQPVGLDGLGSGTGDGGKGDGLDGLDNSGSDGKSGLVDRLADGDDDDSDADESEFADRRHDAVGMDLSHLHGTGDEDSGRNGLDADPNAALPRNRQPAKQPVARKSRFADIDTSLKELEPSNRKPRVQEEAGPEYIVAEPPVIDEDARAKLERDPITVRAGQTALVSVPFSCKGTSCSATWTRDDGATEVREDERTHLERSDRDATFTLSRCKRGDSGDLKLQLKSPMGTAEINMQLEVIDKPSLPVGPLETSVAGKLVTMTWQPPLDDGGRPVSRYLVERRQADKRSWVPVGDAAGDAASFKTDKVDEGKAYQFRVRAVNSEGESDALESGTVTIEKQATPPSAPGSPRATNVTKNTVSLMWTEPKNTGGAPVASYVLEKRNRGTVAWSYASTSAIYDTQHTVKGLDEGTWYEFRVTAVNSAGRSEPSAVSQPALPKEPLKCPGSVHGLAVSKLAAQGFTLSWKPPVDGGDPEGYIVETCPEGSSEWTRANKALATQPSYTVGGIHDRRMYFVRVTAVNETGLGKPTQLDTCVSAAPPSVRPSFKLDSSTSSYMRVKAGNTVRLKVLFTGSPAPEADWLKEGVRLSTRVAITSTSGSSQMLIPCAALKDSGHYTLVISNEAGSETHSIFMKVIDVPSSPGHVSLVEKVPGTVTVCWSASRDEVTDDELTYTVLRREVNNKVWTEIGDHINNNSFTVTDSVTGQPYMFRVVAVNSVGRSYPSESKEPWSLMRRREPVGLVMPRYRGWNEASAPAFLVPLRSHVVTRGTECRMSCAVRGCPRPIVTWFKGGQSLWGSQRACPTETVGVCSLLLPVVDFEDAGMYTVHAQNPHGKTECSASLDVKDCSVD
ncbi:immunoglobulin-like and fibronectin type III domain-containing protein 1 [Petromyzon marinus]|uniref:immunoglobulin-like and fibronectin type III domain-containing protein 1 n=1 Tax=Petromyzon marinus TaxID=7757 RepID=UPI00140245E6|nr:immunoglobulin-like and fibronectin type III domain-containing protein 1 isoform X7 [Petromyzon marinus]